MKFALFFILFLGLFSSPILSAETESFNRTRTYDVQHYVMRLSFDHLAKKVFGDSTVRLKPLSDGFQLLELDAANIKFNSVKLEKTGVALNYRLAENKILITLDRPYKKDEEIAVRFGYEAKPSKGIYFVDAEKRKGRVVRSEQIWTQGESEETHHWLPSFDFPDDKATTEQLITVKNGETVIGNGELIREIQNANGTVTFHYKMPVPHSLYLTSFIVGKYLKISEKYRSIPLNYYVYPNQKALVPKAYGKTKDMFRIFEEVTGVSYPYNKYDQTIVAGFNFGGMENITATTMADSEIMMANYAFGKPLVEDLVSHELAHSWFGNLVTCRNWAELWLNESFATFMEAAYREKMYGRKDYIRKIREDAAQYFGYSSSLANKQHGLFNTTADPNNDDTMFDPITYNKGSAVIHTLREEIGEKAFWNGVNLYLDRHKFANVETEDLQKAFEEASGKDLEWFFAQWVKAEGYPQIQVEQNYIAASKTLELIVKQIQTADSDTPEAFVLPFDIEIISPVGKQTKRVVINARKQKVSFETDGKPDKVIFDSGYKIPLKTLSISALKVIK